MKNILLLSALLVAVPAISQQDTLKKDPKAQEGLKKKMVIERAPAPEKPEPGNKLREENQREEPRIMVPVPPPAVIDQKIIEEEIIAFPDKEAEFPGGKDAMFKFINETMVYPPEAIDMGDQGRVYLSFVVEKDGRLTNVKIERGVIKSLDQEAKRIVRKMPNWTPGEVKGEAVRSRARLPIQFMLKE